MVQQVELQLIEDERLGQRVAGRVQLVDAFLAEEILTGKLDVSLQAAASRLLIHGHCHQKAFGAMSSVQKALGLVPDLDVKVIASSCCGMAGAFGYEAEHYETSVEMAELSLLPAVRDADAETLVVADGTSCRTQIRDGARREALHVARVLELALRKT